MKECHRHLEKPKPVMRRACLDNMLITRDPSRDLRVFSFRYSFLSSSLYFLSLLCPLQLWTQNRKHQASYQSVAVPPCACNKRIKGGHSLQPFPGYLSCRGFTSINSLMSSSHQWKMMYAVVKTITIPFSTQTVIEIQCDSAAWLWSQYQKAAGDRGNLGPASVWDSALCDHPLPLKILELNYPSSASWLFSSCH